MAPDRPTTIPSRTSPSRTNHASTSVITSVLLGAVLLLAGLLTACGTSTESGTPSRLSVNSPATTAPRQPAAPSSAAPQDATGSPSAQSAPEPDDAASAPATSEPTTPSAEPTGPVSSAAGRPPAEDTASSVERCHTSMLDAGLRAGHPGAGQRYADLTLTNSSDRACRIHGYPGLQLVGANSAPLPTDVVRNTERAAHTAVLAPGESASATLHWGVVPTGDESTTGPCQPDPQRLRVIPPDETDSLSAEWPFGPVCADGRIRVTAFE